MSTVSLALMWHQHQPYYPDDVGGENPMPWVRLHGVKDYYGMALHLLEVPEMRCTINLVPSLLMQLRAYTDHRASDRHLDISRIPADSLSREQACFRHGGHHALAYRPFRRPESLRGAAKELAVAFDG